MLLAEELFLLATNEAPSTSRLMQPSEKITAAIPLQVRHAMSYVLPASLLAEMALMGEIRLNDDGKVIATTRTPEPDSPAEQIWKELQRSWGKFTPQTWYRVFATMPGRRMKLLCRRLAERGLLREERKRFLLIFPYSVWMLNDEATPRKLKEKILNSLRTGLIKSDPRLIVTARLCAASGLLARWMTAEELTRTLAMLDELTSMNVWTNDLQKEQLVMNGSDGGDAALLAVIMSSAASGGSDGTWTSEGGSYFDSEAGTNGDGSSSDSTGAGGGDSGGGDGGGGGD